MIEPVWYEYLKPEFESDLYKRLEVILTEKMLSGQIIFPARENIFRALSFFKPSETKVVILGQDPYHGEGQADGLAFSVPNGAKEPSSLRNILIELVSDLDIRRTDTSLDGWAKQGVLLLNTALTVEAGKPASHADIGWQNITMPIIRRLSKDNGHVVFILWGKHAQSFGFLIDRSRHTVIESKHPSPLSAYNGFFGSKPFSATNEALRDHGQAEIDWSK